MNSMNKDGQSIALDLHETGIDPLDSMDMRALLVRSILGRILSLSLS